MISPEADLYTEIKATLASLHPTERTDTTLNILRTVSESTVRSPILTSYYAKYPSVGKIISEALDLVFALIG